MRNAKLKEAIELLGGYRPASRKLGISHQSIWKWKTCPVKHVIKLSKLTKIPLKTLRPDVFCD